MSIPTRDEEVEAAAGNGLHVVQDFLEEKMKLASREMGTNHIPNRLDRCFDP